MLKINYDCTKSIIYEQNCSKTINIAHSAKKFHFFFPLLPNQSKFFPFISKFLFNYNNWVQVGQYLESILEQIDLIETEDKPIINQEKKLIKIHFLYDVELIISHNQYAVPENSRGLTEHQIKSYINDVYIKKQISDFGFNAIRSQVLKQEKSPIMDYIIEERKSRLFDVFEGADYYYLITPPSNNDDPYSLRRFFYEEPSRFKEFYYLNAIVIDKQVIRQPTQEAFDKIQRQIQSFISINKSVSPQMVTFIEKLDFMFQVKILPLLETSLDAKTKYSQSVQERLFEIEQSVAVYLLQEIMQSMRKIASHQDDYEYLYIHSILLFSNLIFAYEIFQSQPALLFNNQAKEFKYRLIAWIKIVQKRRSEIFVHLNEEDTAQCHTYAMQMIEDVKEILDHAMKKVRAIQKTIRAKEREQQEMENAGFLQRIFKKKEDFEYTISKLNDDIFEVQRVAFIDIIRKAKTHQKNVIFLEYENVIGITDTHRHYAVNMGDNGFTRLPILIKLPEDKTFFDVGETYNSLVGAFALLNQDWSIEKFEQMKQA